MNVAVIGTGNVGGALGRALAGAGQRVWFGSRHPDGQPAGAEGAEVTTVAAALAAAEVVVLTVPGGTVAEFLGEHGAALAGKLVVDAANRIGGQGPAHSAALFAEQAPAARYARAFNTLGWENFAEPRFAGAAADLFYSCAEADRAAVAELISAVGLNPVYVGADQYDLLDGVLRLWFALAVGQQRGRHLAFKVLQDTP